MKRIQLVVMTILLSVSTAGATDFVAEKLEARVLRPGVFQFVTTVLNDNVINDPFAVRVEVWLGTNSSGTKVYDYTQDEPTLASGARREVVAEMPFEAEEAGSYYATSTVVYQDEVDPSDNIISLIFEYLRAGCETEETWHAGPAMSIDRNLTLWLDNPAIGDKLRPGDVVGISALVSDQDYLEHGCGCAEEDTSVLRGPFPDQIEYEWSIEGEGSLVQSPAGTNTVMWQLPLCEPTGIFTTTVTLTVRNKEGKGPDQVLTGSVRFSANAARLYDPDGPISWEPYTYSINAQVTPLTPGTDDEPAVKEGESCTPLEPIWDKGQGISVDDGIQATSAPFLCPEYLTLLSVGARDLDGYLLICEGDEQDGCSPSDTLSGASEDHLTYTWSIVGGAGEFPAGNTGSTVVVRRSALLSTIVECRIDDGALQAGDDAVVLRDTLEPVGRPKALVALGDDEGTSLNKFSRNLVNGWSDIFGQGQAVADVYGGRSGALRSAYNSVVSSLTNAGYDVIADDSLESQEFTSYMQDPCIKAFAFIGHGSGGNINMARFNFNGSWSTPTKRAESVTQQTENVFGCDRSPFIRDLQLLACETMQGDWDQIQVLGRSHGWRTTKAFASIRWYAFWSYTPYPPIILTVD